MYREWRSADSWRGSRSWGAGSPTDWIILRPFIHRSFSRQLSCTGWPRRYDQAIRPPYPWRPGRPRSAGARPSRPPSGASIMPRLLVPAVIILSLIACGLHAADAPPKTARGDRQRDAYFRQQVKRIADADLADIRTRADWEKKRP